MDYGVSHDTNGDAQFSAPYASDHEHVKHEFTKHESEPYGANAKEVG